MSFETRYKCALEEARKMPAKPEEIQMASERLAVGGNAGRSLRLAKVGGLALAVALMGGALLMAPSRASALERLKKDLESVPASKTSTYRADGRLSMEYWREGVKRRYVIHPLPEEGMTARSDRGYDGHVTWSLGDHEAVISDEEPFGFGFSGTSIEEVVKSWNPALLKAPVRVTNSTATLKGESVEQISIEGEPLKMPAFREILSRKAGESLPFRVDYYTRGNRGYELVSYATIDYPADLADAIFELRPPQGTKVYDHRLAKQKILEGLQGIGESQTIADTKLTILGAFEDSWGSVFVLWTGGPTPPIDCTAGVLDEKGRGYGLSLPFPIDPEQERSIAAAKNGPLGRDQTNPYQVVPFFKIGGTPVYALQARVESLPSMGGRKLTVKIPVCQETPRRVLRYGEKGAWFACESKQVMTATFEVETVPVHMLHRFLMRAGFTKNQSWGGAPLDGLNVDLEREDLIRKESQKRFPKGGFFTTLAD